MNYKIPKPNKQQIKKTASCLTVLAALFLGLSYFFHSEKTVSALPSCVGYTGVKSPGINCVYPSCATVSSPSPGSNCLPSCASLTAATSTNGSATPSPGVNCYYLNLPLCTATSYSVSITDTGAIPSPRSNCADAIDLPLCWQMTPATGGSNPPTSCINECDKNTVLTDTATSGHNVSCVRFCDNLPAGMTANPRTNSSAGNCVYRKCHQLATGTLPTSSNCSKSACNLLTPDELDDTRMQDESDANFAEYCDGSSVKCYNFTAAQLPYTRFRYTNTMCQIHSCKPDTTSCGRKDTCTGFTLGSMTTDDTQNVSCNTTSLTFSDGSVMQYPDLYSKYINIGLPITDTSLCTPVVCKPTVYVPYPCSGTPATTRHASCDSTGDGSVCGTTACAEGTYCRKDLGYCYQTIDCNLAANSSNASCLTNTASDPSGQVNLADDTNSWFYRPVPPNKAYKNNDPSQGYRNAGFCYSKTDMKTQPDSRPANGCDDGSKWGCETRVDLGLFTIYLGYFHMQWGPDDITRSPKMCDVPKNGFRGTGYLYLCGNSQNLYAKISEKTAYYEGYVQTQFMDDSDTLSTVRVCLRFKNTIRPDDVTMSDSETCGSRECAVSCAFGLCKGQICGEETCRSLQVQYSNSKECVLDNDMFLNNDDNRKCAAVIDNFLRVRAVQYGHRICSFIDVKGTFAYNKIYYDGSEKLDNGVTCVSGSYDPNTGNCSGGKNTNDDYTLADRWRTALKIRYTGGNVSNNGVWGFYQKDGKFIKAQECVQVPLTTAPPDLYNLGTVKNSLKLFAPPLFIRSVHTTRGGGNATDATSSYLGTTDFLTPEIVVQFGTTLKTLSLGTGFSGYEVVKDPQSYALDSTAMKTVVNGITYSAGVLIKKEIDSTTNQPTVCLYQRVSDTAGFADIKISCTNRTSPDINNTGSSYATTVALRKILISSSTSNANVLNNGVYGDSSISLKYCPDASCTNTNTLTFINTDPTTPTCIGANENNFEKYKICAQRDICTKLWKECMENEIAIQNNGLTSATNAIRTDCKAIATNCNARKGITTISDSLIDQAGTAAGDPDAYGWFNELCIVSGFEKKLGKVYGKNSSTGMGKCLLVAGSPASCNSGGNAAAGCYCQDASSGTTVNGYTIRTQTPREAGLCVDLPTPQVCSSVNYGGDSFNSSSIDGTAYVNDTPPGTVNNHHNRRKLSDVSSSTGIDGGHGEYPSAVVGMNGVVGTCNGFWQMNGNIPPKMNCTLSGSTAKWSGVTSSSTSASCVRYYCSAISTGGSSSESDANGNYPNPNYTAAGETSDSINESSNYYSAVTLGTKGASNGYAVWPQSTPDNDFLRNVSSTACITGYSGTPPRRGCNQLGIWKPVNSVCNRIMCPAIAPPFNPTSTNGSGGGSGWTDWNLSRGATFGVAVYPNDVYSGTTLIHYAGEPILTSGRYTTYSTPASRSTSAATPGSVRKGYCNTRLGYFQLGPNPPQATCQSNGTWSAIQNPCVTSCDAVDTATGLSGNHGNATWTRMTNVPVDGRTTCQAGDCNGGTCVNGTGGNPAVCVSTGSCISPYVKYPYTRLKDDSGTAITPVPTASSSGTESAPRRSCKLTATATGSFASVWTDTSSTCVNQCPGYNIDPREGVGASSYRIRGNIPVTIRWNTVNGGETDIQTIAYKADGSIVPSDGDSNPDNNPFNKEKQTAADYSSSTRTNGYFIVTRYCNPSTYVWNNPVVQCARNGGAINNAVLGSAIGSPYTTTSLLSSYVAAGSSTTAGSCSTGYGSSSFPTFQCNSSTYLDQYYYSKTSGTDCAVLTCSAAANSATVTSGNSYYQYSGTAPTLSGNVGDTYSLKCNAGYEYSSETSGDGTCNQDSGAAPAPSIVCVASGNSASWTKYNDCDACQSCTSATSILANSSGVGNGDASPSQSWVGANSTTVRFYSSGQQNCGSNQFDRELNSFMDKCTPSIFNNSSGSCVRMGFTDTESCKNSSGNTRHTDTSAYVDIKCVDGKYIPNTGNCGSPTNNNCE